MSTFNKTFYRTVCAGGFSEEIILNIDSKMIKLSYKVNRMGGGESFMIKGEIVNENPNYLLTKITHLDAKELEYNPFIDIYVFEKKNTTDDYTGLTEIKNANCPQYNKYFDCVMYLNYNILWDPFLEKEILDKITSIHNVKLVSGDEKRKGGWTWDYNKETDKIGKVYY